MLRLVGSCFTSSGKSCDFDWLSGYPGGTFQYRVPAWQSGTRVPEYPLRTLVFIKIILSQKSSSTATISMSVQIGNTPSQQMTEIQFWCVLSKTIWLCQKHETKTFVVPSNKQTYTSQWCKTPKNTIMPIV